MMIFNDGLHAQGGALPKISQRARSSLAKWLPMTLRDIAGKRMNTVNARELHAFLNVGRDFSSWIKDRIDEYGFIHGVDYVVFTKFGENHKGGRPQKEYAVSIDMAKELSMVERNEQGRLARRYFIDCETLLIEVAPDLNQLALEQWHGEREASKDNSKLMSEALVAHRERQGKATLPHHHSNEANLINRLVLGMNAAKWAKSHGVSGPIREHMSAYQLTLIAYLERSNAALLDAGMPFVERKERLAVMLAARMQREAKV